MTNDYYMTIEHGIAEEYLRTKGLNSITWEHFTGNFGSVVRYLEKIANHIYDVFNIDETEVFNSIVDKKRLRNWDKKYLPHDYAYHTHFIIEESGRVSEFGDYDVTIKTLNVPTLQMIEHDLHCAIVTGLANKE